MTVGGTGRPQAVGGTVERSNGGTEPVLFVNAAQVVTCAGMLVAAQ